MIDSTLRERLVRASPAPWAVGVPDPVEAPPPESAPRPRRVRLTALVVAALLVAVGAAWYLLARTGSPATGSVPAAPRVFAWAPVAGIRTYAVEIRRGGVVVYTGRTIEPKLRLTFTLSQGAYQWYVWPVRPGARFHEPAAIIAASFRVDR